MIIPYLRPETPADAVLARRDRPGAVFVSGGTDASALLSGGASCAVSLDRLPLRGVAESADRLEVGALATLQDLVEAPWRSPFFATLGRAARHVNNRHVRNAGTVGGNLAAGKSSSDLLPFLLAADAAARCLCDDLVERPLPIPGYLELETRPLLLRVEIAAPAPGTVAAVRTFTRTANDVALATVALVARIADGKIAAARVAAGCVAPRPVLLPGVARSLEGLPVADQAALEAALRPAVASHAAPADDHRATGWYRKELIVALLLECLDEISISAKGGR